MIQSKAVLMSIPSRFVFLDNVKTLVQHRQPFSLLFIDIVRFSDINRSFGYTVGDKVLAVIAERLSSSLTQSCYLGRMSGDVFSMVLEGNFSTVKIRELTKKMVSQFRSPIQIDGHSFTIDFNIGATRFPQNGNDFEHLLALTESTLTQVKGNRYEKLAIAEGAGVHLGDPRGIALESDLKRAFKRNELELYLQPQVDLRDEYTVVGAECLLRWNHPTDGVLIPGPLIDAAESYNLMDQLGNWVLEAGFTDALRLNMAGIHVTLAINMSPTQLYDNDLIDNIVKFSNNTSVALSDIELELTENVILSDSVLITERLHQLKKLGLKIAIDDFGTGYSNLAYIRDMPIDTIKIDKTFVDDINQNKVNQAIVMGIMDIANALDCQVVAEGIETHEQVEVLNKLQVHLGQGYLFAKPLPIQQFIAQLQSASASEFHQAQARNWAHG